MVSRLLRYKCDWSDRPREMIIRYAPDIERENKGDTAPTRPQVPCHDHPTHVDAGHESAYSSYKSSREYASVFPVSNDTGNGVHRRWIPAFESHNVSGKEPIRKWLTRWQIPGYINPWTSTVCHMFDLAKLVEEPGSTTRHGRRHPGRPHLPRSSRRR